MDRDVIEIQFTPAERSLILRYGYPFEKIEQALKACESSRSVETIPVDLFELERLIGDLSISINDMDHFGGWTIFCILCVKAISEAAAKHEQRSL